MRLITSQQGHATLLAASAICLPSSSASSYTSSKDTPIPLTLSERLVKARKLLDDVGLTPTVKDRALEDGTSIDENGTGELDELRRDQGWLLLEMLEILQAWQRQATTGGRAPSPENVLNMSERRTLQLLIKQLLSTCLLPACRAFVGSISLPGGQVGIEAEELGEIVSRVLNIVDPDPNEEEGSKDAEGSTLIPFDNGSGSTSTSTSPFPLSRIPTIIASALLSISNFPLILSSSVLIGWSQLFPPPKFGSIRKKVIELVMERMRGEEGLSFLGGAVGLVGSRRRSSNNKDSDQDDKPSTLMIWPPYVSRTLNILMSKLVTRPSGVQALMTNIFGTSITGSNDLLDLHRLEHLVRVLSEPPLGGLSREVYRKEVMGQSIGIITGSASESLPVSEDLKGKGKEKQTTGLILPQRYIHAACFVISQLIEQDPESDSSKELFERIQSPFLAKMIPPSRSFPGKEQESVKWASKEPEIITPASEINSSLSLLLPLLTRTPPAPNLIAHLLYPIIPPLFSLHSKLSKDSTADPVTRQEIKDILRSWGRLTGVEECLNGLKGILMGGRGWGDEDEDGDREGKVRYWDREYDEDGMVGMAIVYGRPPDSLDLNIRPNKVDTSDIRLMSHSAVGQEQASATISPSPAKNEDETDELPFEGIELHPDPELLVNLMVQIDRESVTSGFFQFCLERYQNLSEDVDRTKSALICLQVVMLLSEKLGDKIFRDRPQTTLLFVEQALRPKRVSSKPGKDSRAGDRLEDKFRIVNSVDSEELDDAEDEGDSDDEVDEALGEEDLLDVEDVTKLDLRETAITLLVAVVSAQTSVSPAAIPILKVIEAHLRSLEQRGTARVKQLAQSALMILVIRNAGPISNTSTKAAPRSTTMDDYQEALKLLNDPLLPVRGHGLIVLQKVVKAKDFDRALLPAIMDIFMQAIKDEDSFMYLNAIKGLSSMVDGLGKEVLKSLIGEYTRGVERMGEMQPKELDRRLRLGEALLQCVRRAGQALPLYVDTLIPPLLRMFPSNKLPTVLRTSSLSILATCVETSRISLLSWLDDLISACLDLLQLESVAAKPKVKDTTTTSSDSSPASPQKTAKGKDLSTLREPTKGNDGKHPALRRAALVFLGLQFDSLARMEDESMASRPIEERLDVLAMPSTHSISGVSPSPDRSLDKRLYNRAKTVIAYVAATDLDDLVRYQASEALGILGQISHMAL